MGTLCPGKRRSRPKRDEYKARAEDGDARGRQFPGLNREANPINMAWRVTSVEKRRGLIATAWGAIRIGFADKPAVAARRDHPASLRTCSEAGTTATMAA